MSPRNLRDGINHVQSHFNSITSVVTAWLRQPGDTVITVPEDLDPEAFIVLNTRYVNPEINVSIVTSN